MADRATRIEASRHLRAAIPMTLARVFASLHAGAAGRMRDSAGAREPRAEQRLGGHLRHAARTVRLPRGRRARGAHRCPRPAQRPRCLCRALPAGARSRAQHRRAVLHLARGHQRRPARPALWRGRRTWRARAHAAGRRQHRGARSECSRRSMRTRKSRCGCSIPFANRGSRIGRHAGRFLARSIAACTTSRSPPTTRSTSSAGATSATNTSARRRPSPSPTWTSWRSAPWCRRCRPVRHVLEQRFRLPRRELGAATIGCAAGTDARRAGRRCTAPPSAARYLEAVRRPAVRGGCPRRHAVRRMGFRPRCSPTIPQRSCAHRRHCAAHAAAAVGSAGAAHEGTRAGVSVFRAGRGGTDTLRGDRRARRESFDPHQLARRHRRDAGVCRLRASTARICCAAACASMSSSRCAAARRRAGSPRSGSSGGGSSGASLHAKTFAVDRQRVFVGSFNLDPRSARLNTEMGVVLESPGWRRTGADVRRRGPAQRLRSAAVGRRHGA